MKRKPIFSINNIKKELRKVFEALKKEEIYG